MRIPVLIMVLIAFAACGNPSVENHIVSDSVEDTVRADNYVYSLMCSTATSVVLPTLIETDEMKKIPGLKIDDQSGYDLLPGDFDPQSYMSVYCIGRSSVVADVNALWFKLTSAGEYEEAPEIVDIMMVLYTNEGLPIDVCLIASEALGHSYSYVRTDSVFTVEFDEMENISITTSEVAIKKSGFMPAPSETKIFDSGKTGYAESREYAGDYLKAHGMNNNTDLPQ